MKFDTLDTRIHQIFNFSENFGDMFTGFSLENIEKHILFRSKLNKIDLINFIPFFSTVKLLMDIRKDEKRRNGLIVYSCLTDYFGRGLTIEMSLAFPHLIPFSILVYLISCFLDLGVFKKYNGVEK